MLSKGLRLPVKVRSWSLATEEEEEQAILFILFLRTKKCE